LYQAKTVFVLGAGASAEAEFPVGTGLLQEIIKMVDLRGEFGRLDRGDQVFFEAIKLLEKTSTLTLKESVRAGRELATAAREHPSIDYTINALEDDAIALIGKMAISRAILQFEKNSSKFRRPAGPDSLDVGRFQGTWFDAFKRLAAEEVRRSELDRLFEHVKVINFNYDRSLEEYLPHAIAATYNVPLETARSACSALQTFRPYGQVGRLPWQKGDLPVIDFGYNGWEQLLQVGEGIKTFTEQMADGSELAAMQSAVAESDRIVFLGFAFHEQNVALVAQPISKRCQVLATVHGMSDDELSVVETTVSSAFKIPSQDRVGRIMLSRLGCNQFFQEFGRRLKGPVH
jgi:hypothetical protein